MSAAVETRLCPVCGALEVPAYPGQSVAFACGTLVYPNGSRYVSRKCEANEINFETATVEPTIDLPPARRPLQPAVGPAAFYCYLGAPRGVAR